MISYNKVVSAVVCAVALATVSCTETTKPLGPTASAPGPEAASSLPGPPDALLLLSDSIVTAIAGGSFPVRVRLVDSQLHPIPYQRVIFYCLSVDRYMEDFADTVITDVNGEAQSKAVMPAIAGAYKIVPLHPNPIKRVAATVYVNVIYDPSIRVEITPDTGTINFGAPKQFRVRTTRDSSAVSHVTVSSTQNVLATIKDGVIEVLGIEAGPALVIAKHGTAADTARITVVFTAGGDAGANHNCRLYTNGTVYCWGASPGAGPSTENCGTAKCLKLPTLIASPIVFDGIAAGGDQSCAKSGSALYCWGRGPIVPGGESTTPLRVADNFQFSGRVWLGPTHACTILNSVTYCWGDNSFGQLGTGDFLFRSTPTPVATNMQFVELRVGPDFTCGRSGNEIYCWGANGYGQLGRGTFSTSEPLPAIVSGGIFALSLWGGTGQHVCVSGSFGQSSCWGRQDAAEFSNASTAPVAAPGYAGPGFVRITSNNALCFSDGKGGFCNGLIGGFRYNFESVFPNGNLGLAGVQHICAGLVFNGDPAGRTSGTYCWGDNSLGQLGNGTLQSSKTPVKVQLPI